MAQPINPPVPSTPPNSSNNPVDHPQSVCRESNRLRTPSLRPGFISTQGNSRHALVPSSPTIFTNRSEVQAQKKKNNVVNIVEESDTDFSPNSQVKSPTNLLAGTKQVNSRTGIEVIIDHAQDLDLENEKHTKTCKKRIQLKIKTVSIMLGSSFICQVAVQSRSDIFFSVSITFLQPNLPTYKQSNFSSFLESQGHCLGLLIVPK
jgi:hypothetical protein